MAASQEDWIKHRAYQLWEQEGYPSGKDIEHWERAKLEYTSLKPVASEAAPRRKPAAPKAAAKADAKPKAEKASKAKVPAAAATAKPAATKKSPKKAAAE